MDHGFAQLRRGIKEHLQTGRMFFLDFATYTLLLIDAGPDTGIVFTSAHHLANIYGRSRYWFRESLERLESDFYIKRFPKPRSPSPYPVLINRFQPSIGPQMGCYLDATNTKDWRRPVYLASPSRPPVVPQSSPSEALILKRSIIENREVSLKPRAQTPRAPSPPRNSRNAQNKEKQRRNIEARDKRISREAAVRAELAVGTGPEVAHRHPPAAPPAEYLRAELAKLARKKSL